MYAIIIFIFLLVAYKILRRNRNELTLSLASFYIIMSIGLILNAIYLPLRINPLVYILYFFTVFCLLLGQIFLVLFNYFLLKFGARISRKATLIFLIIYVILILLNLSIPGGFTINETTDWKPKWTWALLVTVSMFIMCFIIIPFTILFIKIYKFFNDEELKKKLLFFYTGYCGMTAAFYGGLIYITWDNPIFIIVWTIIVLPISLTSGLLIYYGIGSKLEY